jgi:cell division protein FtsN
VEEPAQTIMTEPEVATESQPKAAAKTAAATTKKEATKASASLGAEPVVLVPPSTEPLEALPDPGSVTASAPPEAPATTAEQPVKKKKTLLDLFSGNDAASAPAVAEQQVAAVQQTAPSTNATAPSGAGYFIQLGTFRTQAEARKESQRVLSQHGSTVAGLQSSVVPATIAGGTRYGVRVGPLTSREQANQVCNSLFAAGERDCLVRAQ